jgi:hypothetical protein
MIPNDPIKTLYFAAIAACVLVLGLRFSINWLRHNRQRHDLDREPRCATCGYILAKGTSTICPECGSDVREHGLITSRARPRVGILPLYIILALISLPAAIQIGSVLAHRQPFFGWRYHVEQMVSVSRDDGTLFGPPRYAVQSEGSGRYFARQPGYVWVYCNTDGSGQAMLVVDRDASQFTLVDSAGNKAPPRPIGAVAVCEFLRLRSPDASEAQLMNASERIVSAVRAQRTGNLPPQDVMLTDLWNGTSVSYSVADSVVITICVLAWVILSFLFFAVFRGLERRVLQKRQALWRSEVERLGLIR